MRRACARRVDSIWRFPVIRADDFEVMSVHMCSPTVQALLDGITAKLLKRRWSCHQHSIRIREPRPGPAMKHFSVAGDCTGEVPETETQGMPARHWNRVQLRSGYSLSLCSYLGHNACRAEGRRRPRNEMLRQRLLQKESFTTIVEFPDNRLRRKLRGGSQR